ncbi:MAG: hypothetical protein K9G33_01500 [Sneathiella sp.]|nr:hypothetical protein [Sneathiella sp.]
MKGLSNLIRVQKWKLNEKRRELSGFEDLRDDFIRQLADLEVAQQHEQEIAGDQSEVSFAYANYAKASKLQRDNLQASLKEVEEKIATLNDAVAECYQELKKYEIAVDARGTRLKYERQRAEQVEIDDLAIDMHRRKGRQSY